MAFILINPTGPNWKTYIRKLQRQRKYKNIVIDSRGMQNLKLKQIAALIDGLAMVLKGENNNVNQIPSQP